MLRPPECGDDSVVSVLKYETRIKGLLVENQSLLQWKADAIARYPDLAVDPVVLKARQMVAAEIGDSDKASRDAVLAGQRDGTLQMRVAVKLLEAQ